MSAHLHWYRCNNCHAVMCTAVKGLSRCISCYPKWMQYLYATPVQTADDHLLVRHGVTHNPAYWLEQQKKKESA
jgi:hypothetical protein